MWLRDTDLSSVPPGHLVSMASLVTGSVCIWNLRGRDLASLLGRVRCEALFLDSRRLGAEETSSLVKTLETRVERLHLGRYGEVTLDMAALTMYDGGGKCRMVDFWYDTARSYRA